MFARPLSILTAFALLLSACPEAKTEAPVDAAAPMGGINVPAGGDIPAPADVAAPPSDAEVIKSGLASKKLQVGTATGTPERLDVVKVNYTGWIIDGRMFDSSVKKGRPVT